jgi:hypothetical protein
MTTPAKRVKRPAIIKRRPAESVGLAGAVALLIARALGVDEPDVIVGLGVVVASLPAVVTWLVVTIRGGGSSDA